MMASLPSGSLNKEVELVLIESELFSLIIKGRPFHPRYEGLKKYRDMDFHDVMSFECKGVGLELIQVFDVESQTLRQYESNERYRPIFFENTNYQLIISPKRGSILSFYHDHRGFREAISEVKLGTSYLLMGQLNFQSEIGLSSFEVRSEEETLLKVTIEVYPSKLDYKQDYQKLLDEVNDEIYNLAYHFLRKTFIGAQIKLDGSPSMTEFYSLITHHFDAYMKALERIEKQPHHKLEQSYEQVRADKIKRLDHVGRAYLRKRGQLFHEHQNGIALGSQILLPTKGLNSRKQVIYNTAENQFVKWMTMRLLERLSHLYQLIIPKGRYKKEEDQELKRRLEAMMQRLKKKQTHTFWRQIQIAPAEQVSLVLQMAPGYRDAFQIYLTVSKGLALQGNMYQMSVKNVAELYEYWTFLKIGQIMRKRYKSISQDVIQVNTNGLFINIDSNNTAKLVYEHPITSEIMTLTYQKREVNPTTVQKPDTSLSITKKGRDYEFNYVFDAKYRIDFALEGSSYGNRFHSPGPLEEDINTMHRYRDSIVSRNKGPYERTAFGAYVLFPFGFEEQYREHRFYKSINEVNIGGLPFLPSATRLVEEIIENIIEKSPDEIQAEGILPIGAKQDWLSALDELVIIGTVSTDEQYMTCLLDASVTIPLTQLKKRWREAKYVALYVSQAAQQENGVAFYGEIDDVTFEEEVARFQVSAWHRINPIIKPVQYGIAGSMITTYSQLKQAKELPELYMKSNEEAIIWSMLRRVSDQVKLSLDDKSLDEAKGIREFSVGDLNVRIDRAVGSVMFENGDEVKSFHLSELDESLFRVFRELVGMMESKSN